MFYGPCSPLPFLQLSSLFLFCRLTDATFFFLKLLKAQLAKGSSSSSLRLGFALLGGNRTILNKCVTKFGTFFVTLLSRETTKEFLGHEKSNVTQFSLLLSSLSLIKGLIKGQRKICLCITVQQRGKGLVVVLVE